MQNNKISVSNEKCRFESGATELSKELVKRFYYAMKRKNKFYKFQRSFHPMKGVSSISEDSAIKKVFSPGESLNIGDIKYVPYRSGDTRRAVPNIVIDILIISSMLHKRWSFSPSKWLVGEEEIPGINEMSNDEALQHYAEFYFSNYSKVKKVKPVGLFYEFLFGMAGVTVFTIMLFYFLYGVFGGIVLYFGIMIAIIATIGLIVILQE